MSTRKIGKFRIIHRMIDHDPEACRLALDGVIVLRAESLFHEDAIEYVGLHEAFAPVPLGEQVPEYVAVITSGTADEPPRRDWLAR